jgi:hypothetical protein
LPATDSIAAQCDGYYGVASTTIRTARAFCSGDNLLGRDMNPILTDRSLYKTQDGSIQVPRPLVVQTQCVAVKLHCVPAQMTLGPRTSGSSTCTR